LYISKNVGVEAINDYTSKQLHIKLNVNQTYI